MKKTFIFVVFLVSFLSVFSCKKDNSGNCTTCSSAQTSNFQVCEASDGNATVNGENTGTPYDVYIADLEEAGASCGGN